MRFYFALCAFCVLALIAGCAKKYDSISNYKETGWGIQASNVSYTLNAINFFNNTGWIVGDSRAVLKSNDGGQNWSVVVMDNKVGSILDNYNTMFFIDGNTGFIGGSYGTLLKTTDAGSNWTRYNLTDSTYTIDTIKTTKGVDSIVTRLNIDSVLINHITFLNQTQGVALADNGYIYFTKDAGNRWKRISLLAQGKACNTCLYKGVFLNDTTLMVSGWMGSVYCLNPFPKDDSPNFYSLEPKSFNTNTLHPLYNIIFFDNNNALAAGWYGTLLNTTDGGKTWAANKQIPSNVWISSVYFLSNKTEGWFSAKDGYIYHTTDAGKNWENIYTAVPQWLHSIYFANSNEGWAVGEDGIILHTTTGGKK